MVLMNQKAIKKPESNLTKNIRVKGPYLISYKLSGNQFLWYN